MKKFTLVLLCVLFATCLISCGESIEKSNSKNKHENNEVTTEPTKKVDNEVTKPVEKPDATPTEEPAENKGPVEYSILDKVKNSSFEEGLVQIGNDVFKNGGYYTVKEFVDEYSSKYDFYTEVGEDYYNKEEKTVEFFDSIMIPNKKKSYEYIYGTSKVDSRIVLRICVTGMGYDGKTERSLNDCVVETIGMAYPYPFADEKDYDTVCWWLAKGALTEGYYGIERVIKKENGCHYEWNEFFSGMNLTEVVSFDDYSRLTNEEAWGKIHSSVKEDMGRAAYFIKLKGTEPNKLGVYPTYDLCFNYDEEKGFSITSYDVDSVDVDKYLAQ